MKLLGVGEKMFRALHISFVPVGKRKKYALADLETYINRNREQPACPSLAKEKGRRTTGTTSRLGVIGFEEARKRLILKQQKASLPSCAPMR